MGVFAVLALLPFGLFAYGCGGDDDGAKQEQLAKAKEEAAGEARGSGQVEGGWGSGTDGRYLADRITAPGSR